MSALRRARAVAARETDRMAVTQKTRPTAESVDSPRACWTLRTERFRQRPLVAGRARGRAGESGADSVGRSVAAGCMIPDLALVNSGSCNRPPLGLAIHRGICGGSALAHDRGLAICP